MIDALPIFFFLIALAYSAVGFAGGSSYLLVLTLAGFAHAESAPIALLCNLCVSTLCIWNFSRKGHLKLRFVIPFLVFSVPMAYWGSQITISKEMFYGLLGCSFAAISFR